MSIRKISPKEEFQWYVDNTIDFSIFICDVTVGISDVIAGTTKGFANAWYSIVDPANCSPFMEKMAVTVSEIVTLSVSWITLLGGL